LNPSGFGNSEHIFKARGDLRSLIAMFTAVPAADLKPRPLHPGDEIRIYRNEDGVSGAYGGLRPDHGKLVWHHFQGKYALENL